MKRRKDLAQTLKSGRELVALVASVAKYSLVGALGGVVLFSCYQLSDGRPGPGDLERFVFVGACVFGLLALVLGLMREPSQARRREYWLVECDQGEDDHWSKLYDITEWEEGEKAFVRTFHGKTLEESKLGGPWGGVTVEDFLDTLLDRREGIWGTGQEGSPIEVHGTVYWVAVVYEVV